MGKTNRHTPKDGDFGKLRALKKVKNKRKLAKANLRRQLQFASEHRANRNLAQLSAAMYADKATAEDFDPSTFDPELNESLEFTKAAMSEPHE